MSTLYSVTSDMEGRRANRLAEVGELSVALEVARESKRFRPGVSVVAQFVAIHHHQSCANSKLYSMAYAGDKFARKFLMRLGPHYDTLDFDGRIRRETNYLYEDGLLKKDPAALYAKAMELLTSNDWDEENEGRVLLVESADAGDGYAIAEVIRLNLIERDHDSALSWSEILETSEDTHALVRAGVELIGWRKIRQGISLLRVASERNDSDALTLLGEAADISGDAETAQYLWKKASNLGNPHAMYYLAKGGVRGDFTLPLKDPEIVGSLHQSSRLGSLNSFNILERNYAELGSSSEVISRTCCPLEDWEEKYDDCLILHEDHDNDEEFVRAYWYDGALAGNVFAQIRIALALQWDFHRDEAKIIFENLIHAGKESAIELIIRIIDLEYVEEREFVELALRLHPTIVRVGPIRIYMKANNMKFPNLATEQ
ncbi:hypothetical protein ACTXOJ_07225 [Glutamicibacter arilaitensis]